MFNEIHIFTISIQEVCIFEYKLNYMVGLGEGQWENEPNITLTFMIHPEWWTRYDPGDRFFKNTAL